MPLHHFTHADAREAVEKLEEAGETVVSVSHADDGVYVATQVRQTRKTGGRETR